MQNYFETDFYHVLKGLYLLLLCHTIKNENNELTKQSNRNHDRQRSHHK